MPRADTMPTHDLAQLRNRRRIFRDRNAAGRVLARMLAGLVGGDARILAIPAGGVPVAMVLARELALSVDVAVVSKITPSWNTEVGYGAVAFDGSVRLNEPMQVHLGVDREETQRGIERTRDKVERRVRTLRGNRPALDLHDRHVVLVDDGLASGFTMLCAVRAVRGSGARRVTIAVPTGSQRAVEQLAAQVDDLYCANIRGGWSFAVADAYERWTDVGETELHELLSRSEGPERNRP